MKKLLKWLVSGGLVTGLLVLGGCTTEQVKEETKTAAVEKKADAATLDITVAEFEAEWDTLSTDSGANLPLRNGNYQAGKVYDTKSYDVTDNASILVTINKDSKLIKDVTVLTVPSSDENENMEIILSYLLAIGSADPSLVPDERGEIFTNLTDQNPDLQEGDVTTTKNGIEYTLSVSNTVGVWLIITNANNS